MSGDRRGFHYALEPMRSLAEWDIDALAQECAALTAACERQQWRVDQLQAALTAARGEVAAQRAALAVLHIDAQRRAHAYMGHTQSLLAREQIQLDLDRAASDDGHARLTQARKFADSLDRDKESAAVRHDDQLRRQAYLEADDNWLQRLHWKNKT